MSLPATFNIVSVNFSHLLRYCSHSAWFLNLKFLTVLVKVAVGEADVSNVTVFGDGVRVRTLLLISWRHKYKKHTTVTADTSWTVDDAPDTED